MKNFKIAISSPPDREYLVAEIFFGSEQFAEINQDEGSLTVEIYPRKDEKPWAMSLREAIEALEKARNELLGIG